MEMVTKGEIKTNFSFKTLLLRRGFYCPLDNYIFYISYDKYCFYNGPRYETLNFSNGIFENRFGALPYLPSDGSFKVKVALDRPNNPSLRDRTDNSLNENKIKEQVQLHGLETGTNHNKDVTGNSNNKLTEIKSIDAVTKVISPAGGELSIFGCL